MFIPMFIRIVLFGVYFSLILNVCAKNDELFDSSIGDQMKIGLSEDGYKHVRLKCGADSMVVDLETENEFDGVIYTRGSFYEKQSPCFLNPKIGSKIFKLQFNLDQCNTKKVGDVYNNVLILQYDKELIMPGDAAFNLECDFSKPRDVTVNANLKPNVVSRISLTDADPAYKEDKTRRNKRMTVENHTNTVILTGELLKQR